ncbi:MAG TPA: FAD binding domain-containing protein [Myxococcota bacterium]|nr:FAD binding domain-containing protein [Myxococcota bacterium]
MLPFPEFDYAAPTSLREAVSLLCTPGARVLAGGTDLLPSLKHRLFEPSLLVSIRRLGELREWELLPDGSLALGAGLSLQQLARLPALARYPGLQDACRSVATPTLQGTATIGGNILLESRCLYYNQPVGWRDAIGGCLKCSGAVCHVAPKGRGCYAAHSADTVPTLWLLGAQVELVGPTGVRLVPISALYSGDGLQPMLVQPGEILTRLLLPPAEGPTVHRKLRTRAAIDYGLLLVAASRIQNGYRAVVSAVGPAPIEVQGESPEELAEAAFRAVQPLGTHAPAPTWRKKVLRVEVRRAAEHLKEVF